MASILPLPLENFVQTRVNIHTLPCFATTKAATNRFELPSSFFFGSKSLARKKE